MCCSGKKCLALRIGSYLGREQGWMAEHMLILCVESPDGRKDLRRRGFPERLRQDELRHAHPAREHFDGWKITTIGDDIAWMKPGADGRLYAINPEAGYFGVAPGTNYKSNPNAMRTIARDTIYTNVALTPDRRRLVGGQGRARRPRRLIDWKGQPWTPASDGKSRASRTAASPRR